MSVWRVEVVKGSAIQKFLRLNLQFQDKKQVRIKRGLQLEILKSCIILS